MALLYPNPSLNTKWSIDCTVKVLVLSKMFLSWNKKRQMISLNAAVRKKVKKFDWTQKEQLVTYLFLLVSVLAGKAMAEDRSHLSYLRRWCGNRVCSGSNRCERRSWSRGSCWRKAPEQQDRWIYRSPSPRPASRYELQGSRARPPWRSWEIAGEFLMKNEERHAVQFENTSGSTLRFPCRNGKTRL